MCAFVDRERARLTQIQSGSSAIGSLDQHHAAVLGFDYVHTLASGKPAGPAHELHDLPGAIARGERLLSGGQM